jgi:alkylhydroperoxidase family enzyme
MGTIADNSSLSLRAVDSPETKLRELLNHVITSPGALDHEARRSAARGIGADAMGTYLTKVRRHAYRVTDEDVEALRAAGFTEDQILEATVSAAIGAGVERLDAGLAALRAAKG